MNPKAEALQKRIQAFFQRVIRFIESLPDTLVARRLSAQLIDSAGSTDSNYRAACRGRSRREFIAKLGVAAEEADESKGWLDNLRNARLGDAAEAAVLIREADEITAILVASQRTAIRNAPPEKGLKRKRPRRKRPD